MTTSSILQGKIPHVQQAKIEIEFSGTGPSAAQVDIVLDGNTLLSQPLTTSVTKFCHMLDDSAAPHELQIQLSGQLNQSMLHIRSIKIEDLNMRNTMEDSGKCEMQHQPHVPSEYMGQPGYQSLKFYTPIYVWLFENERKPTYYV